MSTLTYGLPVTHTIYSSKAPVPLKIIRSNLEFDEIFLRYSLKKSDPITKKFSYSKTAMEFAKFLSDQIDVREDINKCILTEFEILWLKSP